MQETFRNNIYRILLGLLLFVLGVGALVYHFVEKFSWVDAFYFCVVTLATVGFGDLTPHTTFGKLFTIFYILTGVGIFATFVSYQLRGRVKRLERRQRRRLVKKRAKKI